MKNRWKHSACICVPNEECAEIGKRIIKDYAQKHRCQYKGSIVNYIGNVSCMMYNDDTLIHFEFVISNMEDTFNISELCGHITQSIIDMKSVSNPIYAKEMHGCDKIALYRELYSIAECLI